MYFYDTGRSNPEFLVALMRFWYPEKQQCVLSYGTNWSPKVFHFKIPSAQVRMFVMDNLLHYFPTSPPGYQTGKMSSPAVNLVVAG